jgi:hypothetical protein
MADSLGRRLRNTKEKSDGVSRKEDSNDDPDLCAFITEWRRLLEREGGAWKGTEAVAELKQKGLFDLIRDKTEASKPGESEAVSALTLDDVEEDELKTSKKPKPKLYNVWQSEDLFRRVFEEIREYKEEVAGGLKKKHIKKIDRFLDRQLKGIRKELADTSIRELKSVLEDLKEAAEKAKRSVVKSTTIIERRRRGVWRHFWPENQRKELVPKKIDLDTRLQIELGKIFAVHMGPSGITLETIARLIVLAYVAGDLAQLKEGRLKISASGRELTIRKVRDVLRYKRIHNARAFREDCVFS